MHERSGMILWTLGHSTRSLEELVHVLEAHRIRHLVDIRTVPRSRTNPQFNRDVMPESLAPYGIAYTHLAGLGGLRKARADSPNGAWENASFRGYADYMQTPEFEAALEELLAIAKKKRTAIMCAEAVPWRCHRSLVGDALVARGVDVRDLVGEREQPHRVTRFAKIDGARVTYPG
jgi:uncharacterized protein (DUF488 family)